MSYILDALQRADAERERERGNVPGLNSQIVPPTGRKTAPARRWKPLHTAMVVAVLALTAAALWWWGRPTGPAPATAPMSSSTPPAAVPPSPAPAAATVAQATPPAPPAAPQAEPVQPILTPPRAEPPKPRPQAAAPAIPAAPAQGAPATSATPAPTTPATPPAAAAPAAAAPPKDAAAVRSFAELSPEARAQLPQVNVSGSTYSKNPALRMLIVNGRVLHEGQEISPGFKLETIGQRSAVLNHQGMRYSIGY